MKILVSEYKNEVYHCIDDDWKIEDINIINGDVFYKGIKQNVEHHEFIDKKPNFYIDTFDKFKDWFNDICEF
tara:strand:- start:183 stop:398 length:216 start_codon:yes stop_codon:yes gene_type:complete